MEILRVSKLNEVYVKIDCEPSISYELRDYFKFQVPGAKFTPSFRSKQWDGYIYLFNALTGYIYTGLIAYLEKFCEARNYKIEFDENFSKESFSIKEAKDFAATLNTKFPPRDYQLEAFIHAVRERRGLLLSPTASGKSFIIYLLTRYYNRKTIIVVPTTSLIHQMASDFRDYGFTGEIHKIYAGQDKVTDKQVVITTWQSIYKEKKSWFDEYEVVIGDEAHNFKAKSLTSILTKMENCKYRFGFTGSLDGTQTHKLVLEGLFGPVRKVATTAKLIEDKHLSEFQIKAIVLEYPKDIRQMIARANDYQAEMDYIVRNEARNKFIKNLTLSLEGNTLLLFQFIEKHGKPLYDMISKESECPVFFVYGGVDGEERERIRKIVTDNKKSIIVASYGTFSTGVNIPNIENIIFGSPSKSRIRNLQSIGRGLRKAEGKEIATLFDIADDISWKESKNYTLLHFMERIKIYNEEKFKYKIYKVTLNV
jgi:superfamily II DNA or RNA helicase